MSNTIDMQSAAYQLGVDGANATIDRDPSPDKLGESARVAEGFQEADIDPATADMLAGFATTIRDYLAERSDV